MNTFLHNLDRAPVVQAQDAKPTNDISGVKMDTQAKQPPSAPAPCVPMPANFQEEPIGHVQAYTFGYDRDVDLVPRLRMAIGAQVSAYGVDDALKGIYGSHPVGGSLFVRFRPFSGKE